MPPWGAPAPAGVPRAVVKRSLSYGRSPRNRTNEKVAPKATAYHHITNEMLAASGIPLESALGHLSDALHTVEADLHRGGWRARTTRNEDGPIRRRPHGALGE